MGKEVDARRARGREFQTVGAALRNALAPKAVLTLGTSRTWVSDDLRERLGE